MASYDSLVTSLIQSSNTGWGIKGSEKVDFARRCSQLLFGTLSVPTVVVAGTKGKGSTCAMVESVLRCSGLKTGLFTSPHLETPRERIRVNGKCVSPEQYVESYNRVMRGLDSHINIRIPFFGLHTLMSADMFIDQKVDVAVVECGIGGRFDWTKIYAPTTSVITHLEFDHTNLLGTTPESIAWHKAGILSNQAEGFTVPQTPKFHEPLVRYALEQGCKLNIIEPKWNGKTNLRGPSSQENTALGVAAANNIGKKFGINIKAEIGAEMCIILGRYQKYVSPDGIQWLLDGAHTEESIKKCAEWYKGISKGNKKNSLILSLTNGRSIEILKPILEESFLKRILITSTRKLAESINCTRVSSIEEAVRCAKSISPDAILVTGSMRLVGDTLKYLQYPIY